eukprot:576554-Hanusia_phi.AAC.1
MCADSDGRTCAHEACKHGRDVGIIQILVQHGGNELLSCRDKNSKMCFQQPRNKENSEVLSAALRLVGKDLLQQTEEAKRLNAYLDCDNSYLRALRICSMIMDRSSIHGSLLLAEVKENWQQMMTPDEYGRTLLHAAGDYGCVELIRFLLEAGGREYVMTKDANGMTCADHARQRGHAEVLEAALGASLGAQNVEIS